MKTRFQTWTLVLPVLLAASLGHAAPPSSEGVSQHRLSPSDSLKERFQNERPQWGVQIKGSAATMGDRAFFHTSGRSVVHSFGAEAEFQPSFIQAIGVIGVGPTYSRYFNSAPERTGKEFVLANAFGGQVRYQAKILRRQWLVPMAAYKVEQASYRLQDETGGVSLHKTATGGLWLSLSDIAATEGQTFFAFYGVSRVYLTGEMSIPAGDQGDLKMNGRQIHLGLRIEL